MDIGYNSDVYKFVITSPEGIVLAIVDNVFIAEKISDTFDKMVKRTKALDNIKSHGKI